MDMINILKCNWLDYLGKTAECSVEKAHCDVASDRRQVYSSVVNIQNILTTECCNWLEGHVNNQDINNKNKVSLYVRFEWLMCIGTMFYTYC